MGERTWEPGPDGASSDSASFRWDLALLAALLGAVTCGVAYWPANAALRDAFGVPGFPPDGGTYWMCWWLPVATVVGVVGPLVFPRGSRSFAGGFVVGFVAVAAVMCGVGYSVDNMPYSM